VFRRPINTISEALSALLAEGHAPPRRLPSVRAGSLRPHHRPDKVWVFDESNSRWVAATSPEPRRRFHERFLAGDEGVTWFYAEARVERTLRAQFN
jgi:hypothetical protein